MKINLSLLLLLFTFLSCDEKEEKQFLIGFSQCSHDPWREEMQSEMQRELVFHPEIKLETFESFNDSEKQIGQIRELIKKKVDLLIVSPNESEPLTAVVDEAYRAGIPVILIDRKTNSANYSAFVGADNYELGKTAGKYIASKFKGQGNIIEIQMIMTISPAIERNRGFKDAISESKNLKIVEVIESKDGLEGISAKLPPILAKNSEINIIFGQTDLLAETAYHAIQKEHKTKQLFFVGIDGIPINKGMQLVKDHVLNASLLYPTGGVEAIQTAVKILKKQPFLKENNLVSTVIDAENVNILYVQFKKMKEQQKDIERQDNKIKDLNKTYSSQRNRLYFITALLTIVLILGAFLYFLLQEKQYSNKVLEKQNVEILEQKNQIEQVSQLAQKAIEEKMRFYSYISHEFRTPLSLILTPTEDLLHKKTFDAKETKNTFLMIHKNANRLLRLVDQFLDLRKLDAGKMELQATRNDMVAFTREIVNDFSLKAKSNNIDLQFISPYSELILNFDTEKLDKVLFNIISNAFKYTPKGGLIHVSLLKNIDKVELNISDNGIGMNADEKIQAFDLFYRGNKNISLGTGLGLALSREFVTLHNGEISVDSEKGKGTNFKITLPFITFNSKEGVSEQIFSRNKIEVFEEPVNINEFKQNFENTIVLIEDNKDLNQFLSQKLGQFYNVISIETAELGWEEILAYIPDLIVSDVMLPGMDGFSLTQNIKEDFRTSHIPVILLTAKSQIESQIEGTKVGADAYLSKPFNQQLLEEKIKNLLENRDRMRRRFSSEVSIAQQQQKGERKFLLEFEALIEKNIKDSTLSVEKLSQELGMSRVQLFRKISALTNKNVVDYIAEYKIQKAKTLLNDHSKNITEIAYELGFNNPSYFTTFFKQKTNQTPSEWRNR